MKKFFWLVFICVLCGITRGETDSVILADSLYEIGEYDEALVYYQKAIEQKKAGYQSYTRAGLILYTMGKYEEALANFIEASRLAPDSAEAWYNLGSTYEEVGKRDRAIECLKKAVSINPNYYDAWNNLGAIYRRKGMEKSAMQAYRKAISNSQADTITWFNMASLFEDMGKFDSAFYYYRKVKLHGLDSATVHLLDLMLSSARRNLEGDRALELFLYIDRIRNGEVADGWYDIGEFMRNENQNRLSLLAYLKCAENNGECLLEVESVCEERALRLCLDLYNIVAESSAGAMKLMGDIYAGGSLRLLGISEGRNLDSAIVYYSKCAYLGGQCWSTLYLISQESGGIDNTIRVMRDLAEKRPDLPYPFSMLGYAYAAKNDHDRAIENFTRAVGLYKNPKDAANDYYQLAKCYLGKNMKQEAIRAIRDAIRAQPKIRNDIMMEPAFDVLSSDEDFLNLMLQEPLLPEK